MRRLSDAILLSLMLAFLFTAWLTNDCHAFCIACWELKGVIVQLKNGTTIEGYATWNDGWAELGYQWAGLSDENSIDRALEENKFPKMIFDPRDPIKEIYVYTHLRSIKYPVANGLITLRDLVVVNAKDIKDIRLNPGPYDGFKGAGDLPLVSERSADLLQTKPWASCHKGGVGDLYWVSYDKSFPAKELQRLCEDDILDKRLVKKLEARDIFSLYYADDQRNVACSRP